MKVTRENFEEEVLKSQQTVLLDLYADWCGPCKMLSPILEEIAREREDLKVCKINVDEEEELAASFGVNSIPMLVLMRDGKVLSTELGYRPKEAILRFIDQKSFS